MQSNVKFRRTQASHLYNHKKLSTYNLKINISLNLTLKINISLNLTLNQALTLALKISAQIGLASPRSRYIGWLWMELTSSESSL